MKVLLSSSAYELTDYYPASEGIAAYSIMNQLNDKVLFYAVAGNVKIRKPLKNAQIYEIKIVRDYLRISSPTISLMSGLYYQLRAFPISSKILLENKVDIVHRMFPAIYGLSFDPISLVAEKKGVPFIIGPICCPIFDSFVLKVTYLAHLSTIRRANAIIVQTKGLKEAYSHIIDPEKIWIIPLGVDTDFFSPGKGRVEREEVEVLTVANLTKRKGIDHLIRAIHALKKYKVKLRIVGEGPEMERLKELVSSLGLWDGVTFEGRVPRLKLRNLYRSADIFCLPSLSEPFGRVVIEAMACGKPVVVTNTEGPSQIVSHMKDGLIVPKGDYEKLAEAIYLLLDPSLRSSMGRSARRKAERYSWKEVAKKIYEVYEACLEGTV